MGAALDEELEDDELELLDESELFDDLLLTEDLLRPGGAWPPGSLSGSGAMRFSFFPVSNPRPGEGRSFVRPRLWSAAPARARDSIKKNVNLIHDGTGPPEIAARRRGRLL